MTSIELAQKGYESYGDKIGWKNYLGLPMPKWEDLPEAIKGAWCASAQTMFDEALASETAKLLDLINRKVDLLTRR